LNIQLQGNQLENAEIDPRFPRDQRSTHSHGDVLPMDAGRSLSFLFALWLSAALAFPRWRREIEEEIGEEGSEDRPSSPRKIDSLLVQSALGSPDRAHRPIRRQFQRFHFFARLREVANRVSQFEFTARRRFQLRGEIEDARPKCRRDRRYTTGCRLTRF